MLIRKINASAKAKAKLKSYLNNIEKGLLKASPKQSGNLSTSINAQINEEGSIDIWMNLYGLFQDKGVNGIKKSWGSPYSYKDKMPPASAFSVYSSTYAFAIARSIYNKGIRPTHWITNSLEKTLKDNDLLEAIWESNFTKKKYETKITISKKKSTK